MSTTIDFNLTNAEWGRIWGDRATLVSPAHLLELNSISAQTHLSAPGYWRNLFSSYREVRDNAGRILQNYTSGGRDAVGTIFQNNAAMISPHAMNADVTAKRNTAIQTAQANILDSEKNRTKYIVQNAVERVPVLNTVVRIGGKVLDTAENVVNAAGSVVTAGSNIASALSTIANNVSNDAQNGSGLFGNLGTTALLIGGGVLLIALKR